eukprot:428570_1
MSYNETVPDFQIVRNKKKKLQCNICKQRFKVPQLSRDNEASHIGSNRHQAALTTITNAIQQRNRNRNILFGLLRRAAPQHQNDQDPPEQQQKDQEESDDEVLHGLIGREQELKMEREEMRESSPTYFVYQDRKVDFFYTIEYSGTDIYVYLSTEDATSMYATCKFVKDWTKQREYIYAPVRHYQYMGYMASTNNEFDQSEHPFADVYAEFDAEMAEYKADEPHEFDIKKATKPTSMIELKQLITEHMNDCIKFFERNGIKQYNCDECLQNIDIAKKLNYQIIGALTEAGAEARLSRIWRHLIGCHENIKEYKRIINIEYEDEWVDCYELLDNVEYQKSVEFNVAWKGEMMNFLRSELQAQQVTALSFSINLKHMMIRCNICHDGYQKLILMEEPGKEKYITPYVDGTPMKNMRPHQLTQQCECQNHSTLKRILLNDAQYQDIIDNDNDETIAALTDSYDKDLTSLDVRFIIHLFRLKENFPNNRFKSFMKLLSSLNTPHLGVSGCSSSVVSKQTALCGVYIQALNWQYIIHHVRAMSLGLDAVKTPDDKKIIHMNLRFVVEAYPITIHMASRRITGSCTGEKLLELLKAAVTGTDIEDINYIGITVGKSYYEFDDEKDIVHYQNVLKLVKDAGVPVSMLWEDFVKILHHFCSDGGGDVFGKNIGLRGRMMKIKKELCGVELSTTHGVAHQIDLFAHDSFLICALFDELIDGIKDKRSFVNRSEATKNLYYDSVCLQCIKYLVIPRDFETRWLINLFQALKAFGNNFKGFPFMLEQKKDVLLAKCREESDKLRLENKMGGLVESICNMKMHMMAYAGEDLLKTMALKYQVLTEMESLNVIQYVNEVNAVETSLRCKLNSMDRQNRMYPWMVEFHDEHIINYRKYITYRNKKTPQMFFRYIKYEIKDENKNEDNDVIVYDEYSSVEYYKIVRDVQAMYVRSIKSILEAIAEHKKKDEFKNWYIFKQIADYSEWRLNNKNKDVAIKIIQTASKQSIIDLYDLKYEALRSMGMDELSKQEFIEFIVKGQTEVINAIASLRVEGQENMTLEQIIKQKHLDFYDIYALAVAKIQRVHPFYFAYEYFISKQPANVFSEREGHMGNLIRDKLAMKMGIQLFDNHLKGYFNLPDDITTEKHKVHIKNLSWLWRYVVRGHDVEKPNDLAKKLDLEIKIPKIVSKSYNKVKRVVKRNGAKDKIWSSVPFNVRRWKKRLFANRGVKSSKSSKD